jgi:hypothetical protein
LDLNLLVKEKIWAAMTKANSKALDLSLTIDENRNIYVCENGRSWNETSEGWWYVFSKETFSPWHPPVQLNNPADSRSEEDIKSKWTEFQLSCVENGVVYLEIFNYAMADPETWVRFLPLPGILKSGGSGTGSTQKLYFLNF